MARRRSPYLGLYLWPKMVIARAKHINGPPTKQFSCTFARHSRHNLGKVREILQAITTTRRVALAISPRSPLDYVCAYCTDEFVVSFILSFCDLFFHRRKSPDPHPRIGWAMWELNYTKHSCRSPPAPYLGRGRCRPI